MSLERFAEIVEAAKQQEIEVDELKTQIEGLKYALKEIKEVKIISSKDTEAPVKRTPGRDNSRPDGLEYERHTDQTNGIIGITSRTDKPEELIAQIRFFDPSVGKFRTKQAVRQTLIEAIIARNEIAAALLRRGLIDFERFVKFTSL